MIFCCATNFQKQSFNFTFLRNSLIFNYNILLSILDKGNSCLAYEVLGEFFEMMYDDSGAVQYRVWQYGGGRDGVRYPRDWTKYFRRPAVYLTSKTGKIFKISLLNDTIYILISTSDIWSTLGHYKVRTVVVTMGAVREPFPLMYKASKYHSNMTYCSIAPLNWVMCPKGTP